jgi:hypothetical protein
MNQLHHITSYLYDNKITLQIVDDDPAIKTRNRVVYNRTIEIYRGTDNPLTIQFKNQDQKPANISAYTISGQVIDITNNASVGELDVTVANASVGTASITLTQDFLANLSENKYKMAFKATNTISNIDRPLYADDNYGLYLEFNLNKGFYG